MSDDAVLRAEAAAREGWTSRFVRALLAQARKAASPCTHDWRAVADVNIICIKCGEQVTVAEKEYDNAR